MKEETDFIGKKFSAALPGFEYQKPKKRLFQRTREGWVSIEIDLLKSSALNRFKLAAYAHVRIECLERVYVQYHPYVLQDDRDAHASVSVNCDNLMKDRDVVASKGIDELQSDVFLNQYIAAVNDCVLPAIYSVATVEGMTRNLSSPNAGLWITSDKITRFSLLLSSFLLSGDRDSFEEMMRDFLRYCDKPHLSRYKEIAQGLSLAYIQAWPV